tara:strand:+ start:2639 stop:3319 length:681 start_codon:yes stop_codon:yes gene_type:complete
MNAQNIISIGGGGFGRKLGQLVIESYIISLTKTTNPKICFLPTATGDNDNYKLNFYQAFTKLNCKPSHIDLFKRTIDIEDHLLNQDIIYVGGGNTKSMLAVWRDWNIDKILFKAYQKGITLSGVSAGAICWFSQGITDSWANSLNLIPCLDFIQGNACPHYDEEEERRPYVKKLLSENILEECFCIEGNSALHFKNGLPFRSINFGTDKKSYLVKKIKNEIIEEVL